jgi:hypothetical protein
VGSSEAPVVQVYPHFMQAFHAMHCGLSFMQSWDGRHLITKVILSRRPLVPASPEGVIAPEHYPLLEGQWQSEFRALNILLPSPTSDGDVSVDSSKLSTGELQ